MNLPSTLLSAAIVAFVLFDPAIGFAPHPHIKSPTTSLAFFGGSPKKSTPAPSKLADEAVEIYLRKYPPNSTARPKFFFESWGMPESYSAPPSVGLFRVQDAKLRETFDAIARLYGEENALRMVEIQPGILAFNKDNFRPSLENFGETFGYDQAKRMVMRNPGLLSVKPANAATADQLTMQMSYVVEWTRPIGAAGPFLILGLLMVPALEGATGVSRGELLGYLFR